MAGSGEVVALPVTVDSDGGGQGVRGGRAGQHVGARGTRAHFFVQPWVGIWRCCSGRVPTDAREIMITNLVEEKEHDWL